MQFDVVEIPPFEVLLYQARGIDLLGSASANLAIHEH